MMKNALALVFSAVLVATSWGCGASDDPPAPPNGGGSESSCQGVSNLDAIPSAYRAALTKYTTVNSKYVVHVCTEDSDGDGQADFMVVESTNLPEHESVYYEDGHDHHEDFDFDTNKHKYDEVYDGEQAGPAGPNMIETQSIVMRMPIAPVAATTKTATSFATIGLALNGVSFFNESAAPGDEITDELFTFDQCSGHPQMQGVYHYHVDPVCLVRDLGGDVVTETTTVDGTTYEWLEDAGTNAGLLLGFLLDGFPVYGPMGNGEVDCAGVTTGPIDEYNGHSHCTTEFSEGIYHYHVKTANLGGTNNPVFWVTNEYYYGEPGSISQ